jgi:small subunit ribosomal protein S11
MGKKRIIQKSPEELIREREAVDKAVEREKESSVLGGAPKYRDGIAHIHSSYNNTIVSICDMQGNVVSWASAGNIGFHGTKKSTPFAATKVAEAAAERSKKYGIQRLHVYVRGIGSGRESAIRSLAARGIDILSIKDVTPIPHGGVRARKVRRV